MLEDAQISSLASQIRGSAHQKTTFTVSRDTLLRLLTSCESVEEQSTSFHLKQQHNLKVEILRDLQFLKTYIQETKSLKLHSASRDDEQTTDISKFKSVQVLEFHRINVKTVIGLQGLRPLLQKIVCHKTGNTLSDVLSDCGGDQTHPYCWNELKEATLTGNDILELDQSLECAPWLHTLDLSHNDVVSLDGLSCLHNLKTLNLAFNKLESVGPLKGPICSRLQTLILKNNFIEDLSGLRTLTNLWVLDLGNNCLVNHGILSNISHLATLQFLNLAHNPLSFHPNHRIKTAGFLHINTSSNRFVLNNQALSKSERRAVGNYYPQMKSSSFMTESMCSTSEKIKKVRNVVIEDDESETDQLDVQQRSVTPRPYLETKRQIEDLHEKFGESWLNSQSGLLDVLGLEGTALSTSPYQADFTIYSEEFPSLQTVKDEAQPQPEEDINEEYNKIDTPDVSFDEPDIEEENIYLATVQNETEPIFIVLSHTHLSERECSTSDEREKWHLESILTCEILPDEPNVVKIDFETMRKDRKRRLYVLEEEIDAFVASVKKKIGAREPKKQVEVKLQCMKCGSLFGKKNGIFVEEDVKCPNCDSTLVVEQV